MSDGLIKYHKPKLTGRPGSAPLYLRLSKLPKLRRQVKSLKGKKNLDFMDDLELTDKTPSRKE